MILTAIEEKKKAVMVILLFYHFLSAELANSSVGLIIYNDLYFMTTTANMNDLDVIGNSNLRDLPGRLFRNIRNELNRGPPSAEWKKIASVLDGNFEMNIQDVESLEVHDDPAATFLQRLGTRGMTIRQFVQYTGHASLFSIVSLFTNATVPLEITSQPFHEMNVCVGELLEMKVEATGFPPPSFQWVKVGFGPIMGATSNILLFNSVSLEDSGQYACIMTNDPERADMIQSNIVTLSVSRAKPMEIREQPESVTVSRSANTTIIMRCDVWGDGQIHFQWVKDGQDLTDGPNYQGSLTNELRIKNIDSREKTGLFLCRITRHDEVIYTNEAVLKLSWIQPARGTFTATDKVALLIGAGDYRSDRCLNAPEKDIQILAKLFVSLNFKVVSLYNLTMLDMISAIEEFKHLVGEGVYCVFYFGGHGFEASDQLFLVPPDVPQGYDHTTCLSADHILFNVLLPKNPEMCCMILDICRRTRDCATKPECIPKDIRKGNYIYCYATCHGLAAYEEGNYGILVSHLKKLIPLEMSVEEIFTNLREKIKDDPQLLKKSRQDEDVRQIPEVRTNLSNPQVSFHDRVKFQGYTVEYNKRRELWENAHEKPPDREIVVHFKDFNIKLKLNFQQEFSNVLKIYISVTDAGPTVACQAYISSIPTAVSGKAKVIKLKSGTKTDLCKNYVTLYDIQRLKTDLEIEITVTCQTSYGVELRRVNKENLGRPLVSKLNLWHQRPMDEDTKKFWGIN